VHIRARSSQAGIHRWMGAVALAVATAVSVPAGAAASPGGEGPVVTVTGGAIRGNSNGKIAEFRGIPYAAAPVGSLRWRAPQAPAPWRGGRDVTRFASGCAQPKTPFGLASTSEDCLYLNVSAGAGARPGAHRPVLVWIHGGGLSLGESQDYDPAKLAAEGTVVVVINYRLGALGFLAHPALKDRGSTGAYGLMDQQAALRWVQRNVGAFGGDPKNVTIAGESAGGLGVLAHVASHSSRGLFNRAIVQSGAFALTQTPLATAETEGKAFAVKSGCVDQSATCLRALPVEAVLTNQRAIPTGYTPGVIDGQVLTQSIGAALAAGTFNRVPIINGTNHDESRLFVAIDEAQNQITVTAGNYEGRIAANLGVPPAAAAAVARNTRSTPTRARPSP
jgi:para-nitrobenzyl esterase